MVWSSAKTSEWFLRCQEINSPCFSNIERIFCLRSSSVYFLCSRTQTWHLEEWWLLCQERTLRKICLNPRPQMLSNYSTLLSRMSCFILGLSRGSSVVAGWAALESGVLPGLRAGRLWCEMWVPPVDQQAVQTSCRTPQAGPQLRKVSTQGKILGVWVGHRVQGNSGGVWRDCDSQKGVRNNVICPDSLKLKRKKKKDFLNCSGDKEWRMRETNVGGGDKFIGEWYRGMRRCELSWWVQCLWTKAGKKAWWAGQAVPIRACLCWDTEHKPKFISLKHVVG